MAGAGTLEPMSRSLRVGVALVAGAFVALAALGVTGALSDDDAGPDRTRQRGEQWNLELVRAPAAWETTRGAGALVAVVDSGADTRHPDLRHKVEATIDCRAADGDPARCRPGGDSDADGHGTHVAAIAVGAEGDGRGAAGVAPEAHLLVVQALTPRRCDQRPCGATGTAADVAAGVRWAAQAGADVINLSVTADDEGDLARAVEEAWESGAVVVAAGPSEEGPLGLDGVPVVVVTAVDADAGLAPYATGTAGARWGIAAPGGVERAPSGDGCRGDDAVPSAVPVPGGESDATACLVGTSMAAPHVAGAAALLVATGMAPADVVDRLLATAVDLGLEGPDGTFGAGLLDVAAAVGS